MEVWRETFRCCLHGSCADIFYLYCPHRRKAWEIQVPEVKFFLYAVSHLFISVFQQPNPFKKNKTKQTSKKGVAVCKKFFAQNVSTVLKCFY